MRPTTRLPEPAQEDGPTLRQARDVARRNGAVAVVFTRDAGAFPPDLAMFAASWPTLTGWCSG